MPWKYLRILRRCTCVTPDLAGRGKMNMVQRFFGTAAFLFVSGNAKNTPADNSIRRCKIMNLGTVGHYLPKIIL